MNDYLDYIEYGKRAELIVRTPKGTVRFYCAINDIKEDCIILSEPRNKHIKFNANSGQNLELYTYTRGGIFKLCCRLLKFEEKQCILSLPIKIDRIQRREYIRVRMQIDTVIKLSFPPNTTIRTKSKNISAKGINLNLYQDISKSPKIELSLVFPEQTINTSAKIVKVKQVETDGMNCYNTSLEFISIKDKEINFIVKKCFEFEAAQRRKMLENEI